jgi:hypothetical protein
MTDAIGNMRTFPAIQRIFTPYFIIPGFLVFFGVSFFPLHKLIANGAFVLVSVFPLAAGLLLERTTGSGLHI